MAEWISQKAGRRIGIAIYGAFVIAGVALFGLALFAIYRFIG